MMLRPALTYWQGWAHTPRTAPLTGPACPCDRPTPRPGAELLRASLCHLCGCPVEAIPSPSAYSRCDLCGAPISDEARHTAAHLRHGGPAPTYDGA